MVVVHKKQILIIALALMVVIAGVFQYTYKKSSTGDIDTAGGKIGDAVYVDESDADSNNVIAASKAADDFFVQARYDREVVRTRSQETLKSITEDTNAAEDSKAEAYEKMVALVEISEKELAIETLLKEKGYADSIVLFGLEEAVDVVIKAPTLTSTQVTQISDIVARQGSVAMTNITVRNMY